MRKYFGYILYKKIPTMIACMVILLIGFFACGGHLLNNWSRYCYNYIFIQWFALIALPIISIVVVSSLLRFKIRKDEEIMLYALPIKRHQILLAKYLAGLVIILAPYYVGLVIPIMIVTSLSVFQTSLLYYTLAILGFYSLIAFAYSRCNNSLDAVLSLVICVVFIIVVILCFSFFNILLFKDQNRDSLLLSSIFIFITGIIPSLYFFIPNKLQRKDDVTNSILSSRLIASMITVMFSSCMLARYGFRSPNEIYIVSLAIFSIVLCYGFLAILSRSLLLDKKTRILFLVTIIVSVLVMFLSYYLVDKYCYTLEFLGID